MVFVHSARGPLALPLGVRCTVTLQQTVVQSVVVLFEKKLYLKYKIGHTLFLFDTLHEMKDVMTIKYCRRTEVQKQSTLSLSHVPRIQLTRSSLHTSILYTLSHNTKLRHTCSSARCRSRLRRAATESSASFDCLHPIVKI